MTTETDVLKQEALPPVDIGSKNNLNLGDQVRRDLGTHLQYRLKKLLALRDGSDWEKIRAAAFNSYHMIPKPRPLPFPGAANLACPFPRIGVDSYHANVMSSLFADSNQMTIRPAVIQKDFANTADKAAQYMTYVINFESGLYMAMDDCDLKVQQYGIGYLEPSYVKKEVFEKVEVTKTTRDPVVDPATGQVNFQEKTTRKLEKKKRTAFDGIKVKSLPVESIVKSPFFATLAEAIESDVVFKMFKLTFAEIKDRARKIEDRPAYYRKEAVSLIEPRVKEKVVKSLTEMERVRADKDGFYMDLASGDELVELAEAFLWYDVDGDDIKEEVRVTFHPGTGEILRAAMTRCRIVEFNARPVDGRGYGEGIPEISVPMCDEWENFHNTRSNAGQWENTTFGFYRAGGRFNPNQITIQPGKFYPVEDPREVVFAQPPRTGMSYFQEEQLLLSYFERLFALDENMQGVSGRRGRTATETMRVSSRSAIRFNNPFNRIVTQTNELLQHIWELNQECAPEEKEFYVLGPNASPIFDKMNKYEYSANMRFEVKVSSVFDVQMMRDTYLLAYRLFTVNPIAVQHPEVIYDLSQKTLDALQIPVTLPKPPQADTLSPFEEHEMFLRGEDPEPQIGEDTKHHYKVHMAQLQSPDIKDWDPEAVKKLIIHADKTKILEQTLEQSNLNSSGMFTGNAPPGQPSLTTSSNPSQMFNRTKVGESGNSSRRNLRNGAPQGGGNSAPNAQASLDQILGPVS